MPNTTQSAAYEFPRCPPTVFLPALPSAPVAWSVGKSISQPAVSKRSLTFAKINKISLSATFKLPNASIYRKNNYTLSANIPTPFHFHTSTNHATISNTPATPSHNQQHARHTFTQSATKKPQPSSSQSLVHFNTTLNALYFPTHI